MHAAAVGGDVSVGVLCRCVGMTRQNYHKGRSVREASSVDESLVVELIRAERCRHRRMGGRKLLYLLDGDLKAAGVEIGRDRFFALLAKRDLPVERRRNGARTTRSWHGFGVFPNLAKGLALTAPHPLWVSDITYVRTLEGFVYLALVTDAPERSRRAAGRSWGTTAAAAWRWRVRCARCPWRSGNCRRVAGRCTTRTGAASTAAGRTWRC